MSAGDGISKILDSKVALITGSTSGIGEGIARRLAELGYRIILNGFGEPELIEFLKNDFQNKYGSEPLYLSSDLSDPKAIERMCQQILQSYPAGVDVLVNNAGFQHMAKIEDFPPHKWDEMIAVMLSAPFHLIRLLLPAMKQKHSGRIINISSTHGLISSNVGKAPYAACKHGLIGLTKSVALEVAEMGITCNAICPGFVCTPLALKQVQELATEMQCDYERAQTVFLERYHPSKDWVRIEQVAEMVAYLCSPAASPVNGSSMVIDTGWTAM